MSKTEEKPLSPLDRLLEMRQTLDKEIASRFADGDVSGASIDKLTRARVAIADASLAMREALTYVR